MNWEASEIVEQESDKFKRWTKESTCIRWNTPTMNKDEGAYQLSPIWTQVTSTHTFKSVFKASDTFDDFQVLIKVADIHRN